MDDVLQRQAGRDPRVARVMWVSPVTVDMLQAELQNRVEIMRETIENKRHKLRQ